MILILYNLDFEIGEPTKLNLMQVSSTRGPRAACGPPASFVRPEKGISQNTMRYE